MTEPTRCPWAKDWASRVSSTSAPPAWAPSTASIVMAGGGAASSISGRTCMLRLAEKAKYSGAATWPSVTAWTKSCSLIGCRA